MWIPLISTTRAVLDYLKPRRIPMLLMERWGPEADGGYVVATDLMHKATLLITGGVGDNVHFEADVARRVPNIRISLFDHTIDAPPSHTPTKATWYKIGLAPQDAGAFLSLESACAKAGLEDNDSLVLKLDIEGAEWSVLAAISPALMERISVLIVEYHHLANRSRWPSYRRVLQTLSERFIPIHVHGNNHSTIVTINRYGVRIPDVLEVTYIKKEGNSGSVWTNDAPTKLDRPNLIGVEDHSFNYWTHLSRKYRSRLWQRALRLLTFRWR